MLKPCLFLYLMEDPGEIILYQPDNEVKLEVRIEDETVWPNRQQLSELFNRDVKTIGKHVNNALKEELTDMARGCSKTCGKQLLRLAGEEFFLRTGK